MQIKVSKNFGQEHPKTFASFLDIGKKAGGRREREGRRGSKKTRRAEKINAIGANVFSSVNNRKSRTKTHWRQTTTTAVKCSFVIHIASFVNKSIVGWHIFEPELVTKYKER